MVLIDLIKEKRPNICDNTVKAYDKQLTKIYSNLGNKGIPKNTKYLQNFGKIEEYIDGHDKITTKKK